MGTRQEIAEVHEFAVVFVFNVDCAPLVLSRTDSSAVDCEGFFGTDDGERDFMLKTSEFDWWGDEGRRWTLITAFRARSSSSNSSLSYGYIFKLWKANSALIYGFN
jgi:hypothetical protein